MVTATSVSVLILLSRPSAKNAIERLSGDQNGNCDPSVPPSTRASSRSKRRSQRRGVAAADPPCACWFFGTVTKATWRPSGDTAGGVTKGWPAGAGVAEGGGGPG